MSFKCTNSAKAFVFSSMRYIFQKPDMDTVLTALLLGCLETDDLICVEDQASKQSLDNPNVYCIECGGSGQVELGNFDHHNTNLDLPPACVQAFLHREVNDPFLERLVRYVAGVDSGERAQGDYNHFGLSSLYSGMRLVHQNLFEQFWVGLEMLRCFSSQEINPGGSIPFLSKWQSYREAKERQQKDLEKDIQRVEIFMTHSGIKGGFLESTNPGIHGLLRGLGCQISIAQGLGGERKLKLFYTISGFRINLSSLMKEIGKYEQGWGGHAQGGIIGSPRVGTRLKKDQLIKIVSEGL